MLKDYDYLFKLLIIGDMGVGKSSILLRFADNKFMDTYITTIGVDFKIRTVEIDKKRIKLQIWDTAGQERFRTITSVYYRNTHGVIVVYDVTNGESFANIKRWLNEIEQNCDTINRVLVGNKIDDETNRIVLKEDAETFAQRMRIRHYEISAKDNIGVEQLFRDLTHIVYEQKRDEELLSRRQVPDEVVRLKKNRFSTKSKNCSC